ncbi:MAG: efflux RND transporter periplasmic adaptor subunit [Pseudomonadota bacterium]
MNREHMLGLGLSLVLGSLSGCSTEDPAFNITPRPIVWTTTQSSDLLQVRRLSGVLDAAERADLSFEVGGKVESVASSLGDEVKQGQVLAVLDGASYALTQQSATSSVQEARALHLEAQNEYRRQSELFGKGWASEAALEDAQARLDTAASAVEVAQARLDLTREDLGDTTLRAPYDGRIVSRLIEPSQAVRAGQTVLQIEGYRGLELSVLVPETMIGKLEQGQRYRAHSPVAPGLTVMAEISEIGSRAANANAFPVTLRLLEPHEPLRAGMTAEVDFRFQDRSPAGEEGTPIRIPLTAVLPGADQKSYAFVYLAPSGVVRKREVHVANVVGNELVITKGLAPGEVIATVGVEYLHDGQAVRLMGVGVEQFN